MLSTCTIISGKFRNGGIAVKCEKCHKNEATVFVTQIINGEKIEMHLCEQCAKESDTFFFDKNESFQKFLSGLLENTNRPPNVKNASISCPTCGMTLADFRKTSKLGCADCYDTFKDYLEVIMKRIQSSTQHTGKRPGKLDIDLKRDNMIRQLDSELKIAIMEEDFERAAELRDKLKELREEGEKDE